MTRKCWEFTIVSMLVSHQAVILSLQWFFFFMFHKMFTRTQTAGGNVRSWSVLTSDSLQDIGCFLIKILTVTEFYVLKKKTGLAVSCIYRVKLRSLENVHYEKAFIMCVCYYVKNICHVNFDMIDQGFCQAFSFCCTVVKLLQTKMESFKVWIRFGILCLCLHYFLNKSTLWNWIMNIFPSQNEDGWTDCFSVFFHLFCRTSSGTDFCSV